MVPYHLRAHDAGDVDDAEDEHLHVVDGKHLHADYYFMAHPDTSI